MTRHHLTGLAIVISVGASAATVDAGESKTRTTRSDWDDGLTLPAGEISAAIEPWRPDVRACWLAHATRRARNDGNLRLDLVIDPVGMVSQHKVAYAGRRSRALDRCLGLVMDQVRFPMRRGFTMAAIPFLFHASARPGAGPVMSCTSPRGCRRRPGR